MTRIRDKILASQVAILLLMLAPTVYAVLALRQVNRFTADMRASMDLGIDARREQLRECNTLHDLHDATGDPDYARVARACAEEARREAEALAILVERRYETEASDLRDGAECYATRPGTQDERPGNDAGEFRDACSVRIAAALDRIQHGEMQYRAQLTAGAEAASRRAFDFVLFSVAVTLLTAVAITSLLARSLVAPLKRILQGTRQVAQGHFNQKVPVTTRDEVGELTHAFNRMARELDSLNRMKAEFLSVASHELKSPITSLRGYLDVLREEDDSLPAGERQRILNLLEEETDLLLRYINQFLDMNRIESGRLRFEPQELPLVPFFESETDVFSYQARSRGIELHTEVEGGLPEEIRADPDLLGQVIRNLLENALRYTPAGGIVTVRLAPERDGAIVFEVSDTGPGLDPTETERIFDKYYRGTASARARGSGLGLSISRAIVEAHGGRLWAEARDGEGARFACRLPARMPEDAEVRLERAR